MKTIAALAALTVTVATLAGSAAIAGHHAVRPSATVVRSSAGETPVIVELFTSEGCSSCPSADNELAGLARDQPIPGARIVALGEHVDYWNGNGWRDSFSSAAFTARQQAYATSFRNDQVYTPQMVVDGQAEFVGSDDARARAEIRRAASRPSATTVSLEARQSATNALSVTVRINGKLEDAAKTDVFVALTQDGIASQVARGENAGRNLRHAAVVRTLMRIGDLTQPGGISTLTTTVPLAPGQPLRHLHLVAFVQRAGTGAILGGTEVPLAALGR